MIAPPRHIAFIPDGNRRWAKKHFLQAAIGHQKGASVLMDVVRRASDLGVKAATFYLFSTENWNRPKKEVQALMDLLKTYLRDQRKAMCDEGVRLSTIGDLSRFGPDVMDELNKTLDATKAGTKIDLIFALNYGSRDELKRAFHKIVDQILDGTLKKDEVTEELIGKHLDTNPWPEPDLWIRTSGEMRLSNFLLWQISYAELWSTTTLWPDFNPGHLEEAVDAFRRRERRMGE